MKKSIVNFEIFYLDPDIWCTRIYIEYNELQGNSEIQLYGNKIIMLQFIIMVQ